MPGAHKKKRKKERKISHVSFRVSAPHFQSIHEARNFLFLCIHGIHKRRLDGLSSMSFLHHDIQDCSIMS